METKEVVVVRGSSLSGAFRSFILCLILGGVLLAPYGARADTDLVQSGQITLNPSTSPVVLTLQGPATDSADADNYGLVLSYHDSATDASTAVLQLLRQNGQYQWQFTKSNGDPRLAMQLGNDHSLTLYDPANGQASIVLNPDPNTPQILIGNSPVATISDLTSGSQVLATPRLYLPPTTADGNSGIVYQNGLPFIHSLGTENLFVGVNAGTLGLSLTSGTDQLGARDNLAIGSYTLTSLQTGTNNTALGANALRNLTSGSTNMAIGSNALLNNNADANLAIGANAMGSNGAITGGYNTAIGEAAGYYWKTGTNNLAIGTFAFSSSDGGWGYNVAIGNYALSGAHGNISENVGIGAGTLNSLDGTLSNAAVENTAVGAYAGILITTGSGNTVIGARAAFAASGDPGPNSLTTGSNNTFIGALAGLASPTQHSNSTAIGYMATVDADYAVVLGHVRTGPDDTTPPVNVGIGTTAPQTPLDVTGDATIRGVLRVPMAGDVGMGAFTNGTNPTPAP